MRKKDAAILKDIISSLEGKVVCFTAAIEKQESDFDPGMRAKIKAISLVRDDVVNVVLDFKEFGEANEAFEQPGYWDKNNNPTLKWHETNSYPQDGITTGYFDASSPAPFEVDDGRLIEKYRAEGNGVRYMEWLEAIAAKVFGFADPKSEVVVTCLAKHTLYQPPVDGLWKCPKCGAGVEEFYIDESDESSNDECELLHNEDILRCFKCQHTITGGKFANMLMKKANRVPCPQCKGVATVPKGKAE